MPRKRFAHPTLFASPEEPPSFPSQAGTAGNGFVPLGSLAPDASGPALKGIARIAAAAPEVDFRNDVDYRELACRSLIATCDSHRVPFDYTINPYRGCEFGCAYCFARYTHEYMELQDWIDFERKIFIKSGAREMLIQDLRRLDLRGKWLAIGTATDPYQPAERRYGITRAVLEVLAERRGLQFSVTTKSDLVARDADLLARASRHNEIHVNVTITTPHYQLAHRTEPRAPRPDRRLKAVKTLADAGVKVGVFLMPVLPRINDALADVDLLIRLARDAGAAYLAANVLFLRSCSRKRFFPFLEERFPELMPYYRRLYASGDTDALKEYARRKMAEIQMLKQRHGLVGFRKGMEQTAPTADQLALW